MNREEQMNNFEVWLQRCPFTMRAALIDVADTADMCKRWFESNQVAYTAADLVAMTALVLKREARAERDTSPPPNVDDNDGEEF